jgi:DUF4097 and DUF4098 domain-containing protein YvlB
MKFLSVLGLLVIFAFATASADYKTTNNLTFNTDGIDEFVIDCGSGFLEIEGVDGLQQIEVDAEIIIEGVSRSKGEKIVDRDMVLKIESRGDRAILTSSFDNHNTWGSLFGGSWNQAINLKIRVPRQMNMNIDDGSGYIYIENINGDIEIDDGSGEMALRNIEGNLYIDDGSGEMSLRDITGRVDIDDGSGEIEIRNITGDVEIDDGSGDIFAGKVDGSIVISDGSGDIDVSRITGDVDLIDDSSGDFEYSRVDGKVHY